MDETFCKICGSKFSVSDLKDGTCPLCLQSQLEKKPQAFSADDLEYKGKSNTPWFMIICIVIFSLLVITYWPKKSVADLTGAKEIQFSSLIEDLGEDEAENSSYMRSLITQSRKTVLETLLMISLNVKNPSILESLTDRDKKFYRYSVTLFEDNRYEITATPKSLFDTHYLMRDKGRVHIRSGSPAKITDPGLSRPKRKIKKLPQEKKK